MHLYDRLLAEFLRRKRADQTVRAFARKIGMTHGTLHRIENLQQSLTVGKLGQILEKLDCSWIEIFPPEKTATRKSRVPSPTAALKKTIKAKKSKSG
jgi:transcriptional regulator with XRE-family HTH domain